MTAVIIAERLDALERQMKDAPKEARMKMLDRTLSWLAAREEKQTPLGLADGYAKSLVQLLTKPESMKGSRRFNDKSKEAAMQRLAKVDMQGMQTTHLGKISNVACNLENLKMEILQQRFFSHRIKI